MIGAYAKATKTRFGKRAAVRAGISGALSRTSEKSRELSVKTIFHCHDEDCESVHPIDVH